MKKTLIYAGLCILITFTLTLCIKKDAQPKVEIEFYKQKIDTFEVLLIANANIGDTIGYIEQMFKDKHISGTFKPQDTTHFNKQHNFIYLLNKNYSSLKITGKEYTENLYIGDVIELVYTYNENYQTIVIDYKIIKRKLQNI